MSEVHSHHSSSSLSWNEVKSFPNESEGLDFESLNYSQPLDESDLEYEEFNLPEFSQVSCDDIEDSQYPFRMDSSDNIQNSEIETNNEMKNNFNDHSITDVVNDNEYVEKIDDEKEEVFIKENNDYESENFCVKNDNIEIQVDKEESNKNEKIDDVLFEEQKNEDSKDETNIDEKVYQEEKDESIINEKFDEALLEEQNEEKLNHTQLNTKNNDKLNDSLAQTSESDEKDEYITDLNESDDETKSSEEDVILENKKQRTKKRSIEKIESPYKTPSKRKKSRDSLGSRNSISSPNKFLLFRGLKFIITGLKEIPDVLKSIELKILELGGSISQFRPETAPRKPLKDNIARYILISNAPQRTIKYLSALASCVPCVNYKWVEDCAKENKLLKLRKYLLPAGNDLDDNIIKIPKWYIYEYFEDVPEELLEPFEDKRIEIVGSVKFKEQWKPILKSCGARTVDRLGKSNNIDYILAETYPADYVVELAKQIGCPICNKEWAIQTIYKRKLQDPNEDSRYLM